MLGLENMSAVECGFRGESNVFLIRVELGSFVWLDFVRFLKGGRRPMEEAALCYRASYLFTGCRHLKALDTFTSTSFMG